MKTIKHLLILASTILILVSCRKQLPESDADFAGTWFGDYTKLTIELNGKGIYEYSDGSVSKSINGKTVIDGNQLKIKSLLVSKKYTIDQRPTPVAGSYTYTMVLSGEIFTRR